MTTLAAPTGADLARQHASTLALAGVASPDADARWLASAVLGVPPGALHAARSTPEQAAHLDGLVARRAARVPLQHLVGRTGFLDLTVRCRPGVFIPRPETEVLALAAIAAARAAGVAPLVLEPCTGSGVVAAALAVAVAGVRVHASDRSPAAVALAAENLAATRADPGWADAATAQVWLGDLFDALPSALHGVADVVVVNPPYLSAPEFDACDVEVREHDPRDALVGGPWGHEVVDRLIDESRAWLRRGGVLLLEVSEHRAGDAAARASASGYHDVSVSLDLAGRPRVLRAVTEPAP